LNPSWEQTTAPDVADRNELIRPAIGSPTPKIALIEI
jgi:hypothetical protein